MDEYIRKFQGYGYTVNINESVINTWLEHRQISNEQSEACGVIISSCSEDRSEFWIESVTTPFEKDRRSRLSFTLQDKMHQKTVDDAFKKSNGHSSYMGTWHTHPEVDPTPSLIDILDWRKCIFRNKDRMLLFVIVGTENINIYVPSIIGFKRLKELVD